MSTKFSRNNLPQKPPPVCKKVPPAPVPPDLWPGPELLASVVWELGNMYTGYNVASCLIPLLQQHAPAIYQGTASTPTARLSISLSIDLLHLEASVVAYALEPDGDSYYAAWPDLPIYPPAPLQLAALTQPRTQFQGAVSISIRGPVIT